MCRELQAYRHGKWGFGELWLGQGGWRLLKAGLMQGQSGIMTGEGVSLVGLPGSEQKVCRITNQAFH
jgi:hypothetical protein